MSTNAELARIFEEMADVLELTEANPFKVAAHRRVARVLDGLAEEVTSIVARSPKELTAIEGIGDGSAKKIAEYVESGHIREHMELIAQIPPGLSALLRIPGLGPKTVRMLWQELDIKDREGLRAALEAGRLDGLPRLGPKSIQNLRDSLVFMESASERTRLGEAMPIAEAIVASLSAMKGVTKAAFAGSLRRGRETIGDLDILVAATSPEAVTEAFRTMGPAGGLPRVTKILASGETKVSVRLSSGLQADLRVVPPEAFGAALLYFTGSKEHNVRLRERALAQGMRLNEYGLFPDDGESAPQDRGVAPIVSKSEEEIYAKLGLPWIPPELREDRGDLTRAIPADLVSVSDIRAELHAHTTASDGSLSIEELVRAAKARGFHTIAVTDHSRSSVQANGLSAERLLEHAAAVRAAESKVGGIRVLAGSEVDIHLDGSLDYDDGILAQLDVVIASPHASLRQEPAKATARLLAAVRHPLVHVIGHPTGRIVNGRPGLEPDMPAIIAAAKESATALEVNANSMRLDLRDAHVRLAVDAGVPIAIDCDVHTPGDFDQLRYGVMTARRGWLTKRLCVNTWSAAELESWLRAKRGNGSKGMKARARSFTAAVPSAVEPRSEPKGAVPKGPGSGRSAPNRASSDEGRARSRGSRGRSA